MVKELEEEIESIIKDFKENYDTVLLRDKNDILFCLKEYIDQRIEILRE